MNSLHWLRHFQHQAANRLEPDWHLPSPYALPIRSTLARSLARFALGKTGDGSFLLAGARRQHPTDAAYGEALALLIQEEQEHSRLLHALVDRFEGKPLRRHWTQSLFHRVRRACGLNFEIQVLVIAELVGLAYYRLLHLRSRDPVLEQVCGLILKDETAHIDFHADGLREANRGLLPFERELWRWQFQILFVAAERIVWIDHRSCLMSIGSSRREFVREARRGCIEFLDRLSAPEPNSLAHRPPIAQH